MIYASYMIFHLLWHPWSRHSPSLQYDNIVQPWHLDSIWGFYYASEHKLAIQKIPHGMKATLTNHHLNFPVMYLTLQHYSTSSAWKFINTWHQKQFSFNCGRNTSLGSPVWRKLPVYHTGQWARIAAATDLNEHRIPLVQYDIVYWQSQWSHIL